MKIKLFYQKKRIKKNLLNPIKYLINSLEKNKNISQKLNLKTNKIKNIQPCYKIKKYLKILDCYGEINTKYK